MFTVADSFVEHCRHITINRPLTQDDFTFQVTTHESSNCHDRGISVSVIVEGKIRLGVLAEIMSVFPVNGDDCLPFNRYHREKRESLANGLAQSSINIQKDYRGCRTDDACVAKAKRVLPDMRKEASERVESARDEIVQRINEMIQDLVKELNQKYVESAVQNLTQTWEGMDEQAGTASLVAKVSDLREQIAKLTTQIKAERNDWMLIDMEQTGWKVNGKTLAQPVIDILRDRYSKNTAFDSSSPFRY